VDRSKQKKKYWNGKLYFGRYVENHNEDQIEYISSFNEDSTISRNHLVIDFSRAFDRIIVPYKFLLFLFCMKKKNYYLSEDLIKYLFTFVKKAKLPSPYIRVQDQGSESGTLVKIKEQILHTGDAFSIEDYQIEFLRVKNEAIDTYEENFFRGIPHTSLIRIGNQYFGNVLEDREIQGECGFPYVQLELNKVLYFLIATEEKYQFTIGRDPDSDVYVNLSRVSRVHSRIIYNPVIKEWVIYDGSVNKESENGTFSLIKSRERNKKSPWLILQHREIHIRSYIISINK
jgi:hypothetical protein